MKNVCLLTPFAFLLLIVAASFAHAGELKATLDQSFYVNGTWVRATDLKPGDIVETADGSKVRITSVTDVKTVEPVQVYSVDAGASVKAFVLADGIIAGDVVSGVERNDTRETQVEARHRGSLLVFLREIFGRLLRPSRAART